jgi:hypothetical protein
MVLKKPQAQAAMRTATRIDKPKLRPNRCHWPCIPWGIIEVGVGEALAKELGTTMAIAGAYT